MMDLILEVTRRYNMSCDFCLRGDAQNRDMPYQVISTVFSQISEQNTCLPCVTFTGGEPSLPTGVKRIIHALEVVKNYGISVEQFYIVTNAKQANMEFLHAIIDWYCYCDICDIDEVYCIDISNSCEHSRQGQDEQWIQILKTLRFIERLIGFFGQL